MTTTAEVMCIIPHPDDVEFAAGGSVARWTREGRRVVYVVCTNGNKGTSDRRITPENLARIREGEQRAAAERLGVSEVRFLGYPDQELEDTAAFRKRLVRLIRTYRPATVVTSDPYRRYLWHRDHRITGQVALDAVFPYARDHLAYPDLLAEGLEPHKVREILFWGAENPNHRIDITDTFQIKLEALRCHGSQIKELTEARVQAWLGKHSEEMTGGQDFHSTEAFHRVEIPE